MKLLCALLVLGCVARGQCPHNTWLNPQDGKCYGVSTDSPGNGSSPAPLKCGKYQHEITPRGQHDCHVVNGNLIQCTEDPPVCADDMHVVTEREWQELKAHIRTLESLICVNGASTLVKCKDTPAK